MNTALTIAGSDSSGGAGIQADLKTMLANGVYGMSVITALTAQNTQGVLGIYDISKDFIALEMDSIFLDIIPDAIKIGMLSNIDIIKIVAKKLKEYNAKNIVLDPVMVATSGAKLIDENAIDVMIKELFPMAKLITPNIPEAEILSNMEIKSSDDMKKASEKIYEKYGCSILCKGGHNLNDANDLFYNGEEFIWFKGERIENKNTHGTGCTLSSAIASNLAKGMSLEKSIEKAKIYISKALSQMLDLGKGSGPLSHGAGLIKDF